jgi:hypothetical protein
MPPRVFANPQEIAQVGQRLYDEKYRAEYERVYPGQFAAIDVRSEKAFVAQEPEDAVKAAQTVAPDAVVHLIKIGSTGAFKVSYTSNAGHDWIFRQ